MGTLGKFIQQMYLRHISFSLEHIQKSENASVANTLHGEIYTMGYSSYWILCGPEDSSSHKRISQIPHSIWYISHNAPFCNRNVHTCAHFCYKIMHCGIWDWCIVGFVKQVYRVQRGPGNILKLRQNGRYLWNYILKFLLRASYGAGFFNSLVFMQVQSGILHLELARCMHCRIIRDSHFNVTSLYRTYLCTYRWRI